MAKLTKLTRRLRHLKNVRVDEISLVDKPAFIESKVLLTKSRVATLDGIEFSGRPVHEWAYTEPMEGPEGKLMVLATAVVVAAGDAMPGGGQWTPEDVETLYLAWAMERGVRAIRGGCPMSCVWAKDGRPGGHVVCWGMTDKAGMNLHASGGSKLPKDAWFVQILIGEPYSKQVIGDKRRLNGVALQGAAVVGKSAERYPLDTAATRIADRVKELVDLDTYDAFVNGPDVPPEEAADGLARTVTDALQAHDEQLHLTPEEMGESLAETIVETVKRTCPDGGRE